eukprot:CAMPEP_0113935262 /NCGR_PEP_ID=MMETSP1339-20121228/2431_1 /TAXON_ID=94617 /ORGANISM="Fibrocapsa japonica" /LENGTH=323 /DNA_ID=CAMNT_0000937337 /DNA_START=138 /DNA_END=1109 /DNA_ORIENTATION=+ /assembly_acc=CAM_ASM_000762
MDPSVAVASKILPGVSKIADKYDGFILDQFGVLHDGKSPLPGAVECINFLKESGKKMIILSNSSKRSNFTIDRLGKFGFDSSAFSGAVTSGEEALQYIQRNGLVGQKALVFSWEDFRQADAPFFDQVQPEFASPAEGARYILCHGSQVISTAQGDTSTRLQQEGIVDDYEDLLKDAAEKGLLMVVANPDFTVKKPDGSTAYMPGLLARRYQELGGPLVTFGKPGVSHFQACIRMLGQQQDGEGQPILPDRIIHVGDSLHHDIQGAADAGIDSLFIGGGIHSADLQLSDAPHELSSAEINPSSLVTLCSKYTSEPSWSSTLFKW